jgi:hypothetical protein
VRTTETQGIRTASKFFGPFAGHSENVRYEGSGVDLPPVVASCSNNRRENIFSVDHHGEKPEIVHCNMVLPTTFHLTSRHDVFFEILGQGSTSGSTKKNLG